MLAKPGARVAGGEIELDHPEVERREHDTGGAMRFWCRRGIVPYGHAPTQEIVGRLEPGRELRVECPDFPSGQRVEREHPVGRRADQEPAVGEDRRVLETRTVGTGRPALASVKGPCLRETLDILRRDLHGTRETLSARI